MLAIAACALALSPSTSPKLSASPPPKLPNSIEIAPDVWMPLVGLGLWQYNSSVAEYAVTKALALGYPLIDHALGYKNADGVARALKASPRPRNSYFLATKIPGGLSFVNATLALEQVLDELGVEYVDLVSTHFPAGWDGSMGGRAARRAQWQAMEAFALAGKARSIGVSHYCPRHRDDLLSDPSLIIKPAANQVEYHIGMGTAGVNATDGPAIMKQHGVSYLSFSTLCGPCGDAAHKELISGETVTKIGKKYGKSGAQVSLKWAVQQGIPVVPKSSNEDHLKENLDLFGWELSAADMKELTALKHPPVTGGGDGKTSGDCKVP